MIDLELLASQYVENGYSELLAELRVCQDVILKAISISTMNRDVTIKGGVVMRSITGDIRRATRDIDFDFIKYSIDEASIKRFVNKLNCLEGLTLRIVGPIEELSQQEYRGKRVWIALEDTFGNYFKTKMDLGVHKNIQIEQEEYCFDVCHDEDGVYLLINSREQIFAEKLRALLRFGTFTGRVKDVFDLCYLSENINQNKLSQCVQTFIIDDQDMIENNYADISNRLRRIFEDKNFILKVNRSDKENWLQIPSAEAFKRVQDCVGRLADTVKS